MRQLLCDVGKAKALPLPLPYLDSLIDMRGMPRIPKV